MKAKCCPMVKNARFWTWENNGWVKITLKPGESITHYSGGPTEEGWSHDATTWTHNDDHIACEYDHHSSCCDGPYSRHVSLVCPIIDLDARPSEGNEGEEEWMPDRPDWIRENEYQRDVYAEMAGY